MGAKYRWGKLKWASFDKYLVMSQKQCKIGKVAHDYYKRLLLCTLSNGAISNDLE